MSVFTLAVSCLTTSNLPWFMDLIFQVPMQYCSLQHRTLLPSPVTSTTGYCFNFGSIPSFFLDLFLHWSPVAYWAPTDLGSSSFSVLCFCLFILFMWFSRQENWSGLPFRSPSGPRSVRESSDKPWSSGERNSKPLQYSCLENHMNSMKRQKDKTLKDELLRPVGAQYASGD